MDARAAYARCVRALTYSAFRGPLTVTDLPVPTAPPGGAVVRVAATGVCRSDWHGWMGHDADIVTLPHVPGHEFAGIVTEVGEGVDRGWLGRAVTAPFVLACGACPVCRRGDGQVCPHQSQPGFSHQGSFAEFVEVRSAAANLVALPEGLDPRLAASLGCRVATAYRAVTARARAREGERVLVLGCGGLGLAAVAVATSRGAEVIAVDVAAGPLDRARMVGADHVITFGTDLPERVSALTDGGVDVSLDCLGSPETARAGILSLARRGRHVQVGLLPPTAQRSSAEEPTDLMVAAAGRVIAWELDILGSHGMVAGDYPPMLDDVATGRLDLGSLLADRPPISLEEGAVALVSMAAAPSAGIVVIDPGIGAS